MRTDITKRLGRRMAEVCKTARCDLALMLTWTLTWFSSHRVAQLLLGAANFLLPFFEPVG